MTINSQLFVFFRELFSKNVYLLHEIANAYR